METEATITYIHKGFNWVGQSKVLAGLIVVITIIGFIWTIQEKLTVKISMATPTLFLNPDNILSAKFEVSNDGGNLLKNVEFRYSIRKLTTSDGLTINGDKEFKNTITFPNDRNNKQILNFRPGEKNTIQFAVDLFNVGSNTNYVDMAIKIKADASILKIKRTSEKIFRFESFKDSTGKLHLTQIPADK